MAHLEDTRRSASIDDCRESWETGVLSMWNA